MSIELPAKHHYLNTGQIFRKVVLPCVYIFPMTNDTFVAWSFQRPGQTDPFIVFQL